MAAVRHLGFWKFNFLTVWAVKSPILHNRAKFREDRSIHCCDIAIFVIFQGGCRRHIGFFKVGNFNDFIAICTNTLNFIKIDQTVAEIWRFKGFFQNGGRPPSWICRVCIGTTRIDYLVVCVVVLNLVRIAAVLSII